MSQQRQQLSNPQEQDDSNKTITVVPSSPLSVMEDEEYSLGNDSHLLSATRRRSNITSSNSSISTATTTATTTPSAFPDLNKGNPDDRHHVCYESPKCTCTTTVGCSASPNYHTSNTWNRVARDDYDGHDVDVDGETPYHHWYIQGLPNTGSNSTYCSPIPMAFKEERRNLQPPPLQPFFVMDWLEDLIPDHQDPQHLATLLKTPSMFQQQQKQPKELDEEEEEQMSPLQRWLRDFARMGSLHSPTRKELRRGRRPSLSSPSHSKQNRLLVASASKSQSMPELLIPSSSDEGVCYDSDSRSSSFFHESTHLLLQQQPQTPKSSNRKSNSQNHTVRNNNNNIQDNREGSQSLLRPTNLARLFEQEQQKITSSSVSSSVDVTNPLFSPKATERWKLRRQRRQQQRATQSLYTRSIRWANSWNQKGLYAAAMATTTSTPSTSTHHSGITAATTTMMATETMRERQTPSSQSILSLVSSLSQRELQEQQQQQRWEYALECWDNALEIYTALLQPEQSHSIIANVQNNRGIALGKLQQWKAALQALQIALDIRRQRLVLRKQEKHQVTAKAAVTREGLHRDGKVALSNQEEQDDMEGEEDEQTRDDTHFDVGEEASTSTTSMTNLVLDIVSTLHNIANVYQEMGRYSEALQVLVQAKQELWKKRFFRPSPSKDSISKNQPDNHSITMIDASSSPGQLLAVDKKNYNYHFYHVISKSSLDLPSLSHGPTTIEQLQQQQPHHHHEHIDTSTTNSWSRTSSFSSSSSSLSSSRKTRHHFFKWHQSARLCTAMGHVYYQAEHWKDAAEAYGDASEIYQRLIVWSLQQQQEDKKNRSLTSCSLKNHKNGFSLLFLGGTFTRTTSTSINTHEEQNKKKNDDIDDTIPKFLPILRQEWETVQENLQELQDRFYSYLHIKQTTTEPTQQQQQKYAPHVHKEELDDEEGYYFWDEEALSP